MLGDSSTVIPGVLTRPDLYLSCPQPPCTQSPDSPVRRVSKSTIRSRAMVAGLVLPDSPSDDLSYIAATRLHLTRLRYYCCFNSFLPIICQCRDDFITRRSISGGSFIRLRRTSFANERAKRFQRRFAAGSMRIAYALSHDSSKKEQRRSTMLVASNSPPEVKLSTILPRPALKPSEVRPTTVM